MVAEDLGNADITTSLVPHRIVRAKIIAKTQGVVSGVYELKTLFKLHKIKTLQSLNDGETFKKNACIFLIKGDSHKILTIERTALNILSRMSAITTLTNKYVSLAKKANPQVKIAATRKTTPLFRYFEKKAVTVGGGVSHRMGLYDMILIKDNHLKILKSIKVAVEKSKDLKNESEIEVTSLAGALEAAESGARIIMLDNLLPNQVKRIVKEFQGRGLRNNVLLEVSGGITLKTLRKYATCGVDVISVGAITCPTTLMDFSMGFL